MFNNMHFDTGFGALDLFIIIKTYLLCLFGYQSLCAGGSGLDDCKTLRVLNVTRPYQ